MIHVSFGTGSWAVSKEGASPFHKSLVSNSLSGPVNTLVKLPNQKQFSQRVSLQLTRGWWKRSLVTQYFQATSRLQSWCMVWGANSHVLPLGGPANIKGGALQSWYFLTLPVSAAAAVNVNLESKRGTGELRLRCPPPSKDRKELRC